jgi:SAM-dependent methyltransferase
MKDFELLIQEVRAEARLMQSRAGGLGSVSDEGWDRLQFRLDHVAPSGQKIRAWLNSLASEEAVQGLYRHILGRDPDPVGMHWALRELQSGVPVLLLAGHIVLSPEGRRQAYRLKTFRVYKLLARLRSIARRLGMDRVVVFAARLVALVHRTVDARPTPDTRPVALPAEWQLMLERQAGQLGLAQAAIRSLERQTQSLQGALAVAMARVNASALAAAGSAQAAGSSHAAVSSQAVGSAQPKSPALNAVLVQPSPSEVDVTTSALDTYYLAFENHHRGSPEQLHAKFLAYQPYLKQLVEATAAARVADQTDVLDLGCGRGEWLEFVQAQGLQAEGIDANPVMVHACIQKGLRVQRADLLQRLHEQPSQSLLGITAFHVAEHLPFNALFELVVQAFRCLKPHGFLLLETPNPENILVATHTFHHDHTHRNPLTPDAMQFLLSYHGFQQVALIRLNPYPESAQIAGLDPVSQRLNAMVNGPQDFAVLGLRPELL